MSDPKQLYATKATATTGMLSDNLATNNERRPILTLGYCTSLILPVRFQQLSGIKKGEKVYLNRMVGNEMNNAGFDLPRSDDGSWFETIGFVASKAISSNSTATDIYGFTDNKPLIGTCFYRLVQKDRDGKLNYSNIISIKNTIAPLNIISF